MDIQTKNKFYKLDESSSEEEEAEEVRVRGRESGSGNGGGESRKKKGKKVEVGDRKAEFARQEQEAGTSTGSPVSVRKKSTRKITSSEETESGVVSGVDGNERRIVTRSEAIAADAKNNNVNRRVGGYGKGKKGGSSEEEEDMDGEWTEKKRNQNREIGHPKKKKDGVSRLLRYTDDVLYYIRKSRNARREVKELVKEKVNHVIELLGANDRGKARAGMRRWYGLSKWLMRELENSRGSSAELKFATKAALENGLEVVSEELSERDVSSSSEVTEDGKHSRNYNNNKDAEENDCGSDARRVDDEWKLASSSRARKRKRQAVAPAPETDKSSDSGSSEEAVASPVEKLSRRRVSESASGSGEEAAAGEGCGEGNAHEKSHAEEMEIVADPAPRERPRGVDATTAGDPASPAAGPLAPAVGGGGPPPAGAVALVRVGPKLRMSYEELIRSLRASVSVSAGEVVGVRRAANTRDALIAVGNRFDPEALAARFRRLETVADSVAVVRKRRILVRMLDATVTEDDLTGAVEAATGDKGTTKVLFLVRATRGMKTACLETRQSTASRLIEEKSLQVGWSRARVRGFVDLDRCYKCGDMSHRAETCTVTQGTVTCYNCGDAGHKALECTNAERCMICERLGRETGDGRPANHRSGGRDCPTARQRINMRVREVNDAVAARRETGVVPRRTEYPIPAAVVRGLVGVSVVLPGGDPAFPPLVRAAVAAPPVLGGGARDDDR